MRLLGTLFVFLMGAICAVYSEGFAQEQLWTYDFGNFIGEKTSGDDTAFIFQNQKNGGTLRIRTAIHNDGRDIRITNTENDIGTYSRMILDAGASGARNIFEIDKFDATDLLYLKTTVKIIADGRNNLEIFIGNDGSSGNSLALSNVVAGIRFSVQEEPETGKLFIDKQRKSGSGTGISSAHDFNLNLVELDKKHIIEIYVNHSIDDYFYYRNGLAYPLESHQQAYWIDGHFVAAGPASSHGNHQGSPVEVGEKITTIRYLGGTVNGDSASMEIDDIVYANYFPVLRDIAGDEGWRMLAVPSDGFDIETLHRQNHIQGITGSMDEGGISNLYSFNPDADHSPWTVPAHVNDILEPGRGFIWYLYDNAETLTSKPLPFSLLSAGKSLQNDVTVSLTKAHLNHGTNETAHAWNLLGNPFGTDLVLDVDQGLNAWATGGNLMSTAAQVWHPTGSYIIVNGGESIPAFKGFFVHNDDALELVMPVHAPDGHEPDFFKKNDDYRLIALQLDAFDINTGRVFRDSAIQIYFHRDSKHGWDIRDARKMIPFTEKFVNLAFKGSQNGKDVLKAQDSRPYDPGQHISIPIEIHAEGVTGKAELSIQRYINIPADWTIEIEDLVSGSRHFIDMNRSFTFDFNGNVTSKQTKSESENRPEFLTRNKTSEQPRFLIHITPGLLEYKADLPAGIYLHQNYPNPFNPVTRITFELPERSEVQLAVYDIVGRKVTTLKNGIFEAGIHQATFNAANLSSGVYLYRLTSKDVNLTRKLTVLK